MLDHLRLTVADVAAARRLYDPVLRCLGFEEVEREDDGVAAHALAVAAGAEILDPPQLFDYEPNYCATFFRDPNGFKLEVVTRIQPGPATQ